MKLLNLRNLYLIYDILYHYDEFIFQNSTALFVFVLHIII